MDRKFAKNLDRILQYLKEKRNEPHIPEFKNIIQVPEDILIALKSRLTQDGYIKPIDGISLEPTGLITERGIEFIVNGGYKKQLEEAEGEILMRDAPQLFKTLIWIKKNWKRYRWYILLVIFIILAMKFVPISIDGGKKSQEELEKIKEQQKEFSKRLDQLGFTQRKELEEKIDDLKTALNDERLGNTQERKEALEALKNGNPTKAEQLFKQRIEKDKEILAENYKNLGNAYYIEFKLIDALDAYTRAIEIKPDFALAWNNKGIALWNLHENEEALKAYNKAIEFRPDFALAWNNKGIVLSKLDKKNDALDAFNRAIEFKSDFAEALNNKGNVLADLGRHEEALNAYKMARNIKKDFAEAWYNEGVVHADSKKYEKALYAYNKAIDSKSDYTEAWYNKGNVLAYLDRYEEALDAYKMAIEIKPDYTDALYNKGFALWELGRHDEAFDACNKAIEIEPDFADAWYTLACFYSLENEKVKALESLKKAIENGYNNISHINQDKDLDFIRKEPEFQEIISKIIK